MVVFMFDDLVTAMDVEIVRAVKIKLSRQALLFRYRHAAVVLCVSNTVHESVGTEALTRLSHALISCDYRFARR